MFVEAILLLVIFLQFGYIIYQDRSNRVERERLQLKLMSKNVDEYVAAVESPSEESESVEDPYVPIEDVPLDKLMEAEDKL